MPLIGKYKKVEILRKSGTSLNKEEFDDCHLYLNENHIIVTSINNLETTNHVISLNEIKAYKTFQE